MRDSGRIGDEYGFSLTVASINKIQGHNCHNGRNGELGIMSDVVVTMVEIVAVVAVVAMFSETIYSEAKRTEYTKLN